MNVNADHFAVLFGVGYNVVNGNFGRGAGSSRNGDNGNGFVFGGRNAFKRAHVAEFGVGDDYTYRLSGIHRRTAADSDQTVRSAFFKRFNARLNVFDSRVGFNVAVKFVRDFCAF